MPCYSRDRGTSSYYRKIVDGSLWGCSGTDVTFVYNPTAAIFHSVSAHLLHNLISSARTFNNSEKVIQEVLRMCSDVTVECHDVTFVGLRIRSISCIHQSQVHAAIAR